jgi:predicted ATPase
MPANMLTKLKIDNFKSLKNTTVRFSKNTFLIGLNGAGKTTILQAIDFLSVLATGKVEEWLEHRQWNKKDLTFFGNRKSLIDIEVSFKVGDNYYKWEISFNKQQLRCTKETIWRVHMRDYGVAAYSEMLSVSGGEYRIQTDRLGKYEMIHFNYQGSILSGLKTELLTTELKEIRDFFTQIRSSELLSPSLMKKRARESNVGIGLGGEKLSAFVNGLTESKKRKLSQALKEFFPNIKSLETKSLRSGWKTLSLVEKYDDENIETDSMHLSDGMLRILAILSQLLTTESILIFDEIEDGINQEFVEKLVDILVDSEHQTIVATHSPLLLNYLKDQIAKESIVLVYKQPDGTTRTVNFFETIKKYNMIKQYELDIFGAGEWMQSVNLLDLTDKLLEDKASDKNSN